MTPTTLANTPVTSPDISFSDQYITFVLALVLVLIMLVGVVWILKRLGIGQGIHVAHDTNKQLEILETKAIDGKRRLIRFRNGAREHLVMTGIHQDLHISSYTRDKNDINTTPATKKSVQTPRSRVKSKA